jgi:hypothetical protein
MKPVFNSVEGKLEIHKYMETKKFPLEQPANQGKVKEKLENSSKQRRTKHSKTYRMQRKQC